MIQVILAAFTMGLLGSFHCVGMCGPLALSLPLNSNSNWAKFSGALLYNSGRIITYSVFGLLFGIIGKSFSFFGFQQWLSIIVGVLILYFVMLPEKTEGIARKSFVTVFFERIRTSLGRQFSKKNNASLFSIGLLNGLLPCGLVYMAAAGAVATGDVLSSVTFMAFFGLGTLPIMWSVAFLGNYIGIGTRQKIRRAYPYMMMLMGFLLILRGMGLGIPLVSPKMECEKDRVVIECYAKP